MTIPFLTRRLIRPSVAAAMRVCRAPVPQPDAAVARNASRVYELDTAGVQAVELTGRPAPDELDDLGRTHGDDAPSVPMREAAKRTKKRKEDDDPEPLPPERPHPVRPMQEDDDPPIRVRVVSDSAEKATHGPVHAFRWSKDFRSLNWGGREFPPFTFTQAACMKTLWEHLQNGTRWTAQAT